MESLTAAQQYCSLATCRRSFLLNYFGEKYQSDKCGLSFTWFYLLNFVNYHDLLLVINSQFHFVEIILPCNFSGLFKWFWRISLEE